MKLVEFPESNGVRIVALLALFLFAGCFDLLRPYSSAHPRQENKAELCADAARKGWNETGCQQSMPSTWFMFGMPAVNGARSLSHLLQPSTQPVTVICTDKCGAAVACHDGPAAADLCIGRNAIECRACGEELGESGQARPNHHLSREVIRVEVEACLARVRSRKP